MTYFKSGGFNALCDVCGFKFKSNELKKRWDGLMVCEGDFEHDHPQKFLRVREDKIAVPWVRPRPEDLFITLCTAAGATAFADLATADCARAGIVFPSYNDLTSST